MVEGCFPSKQGDDFALVGKCKLPAGNWRIDSQVRRAVGGAPWVLTVTPASVAMVADGEIDIAFEASETMTKLWPPEKLRSDVRFIDDDTGLTAHTGIFYIDVAGVVTR